MRIEDVNDREPFQIRRFGVGQLMLVVFNIACFVSFTRFAYSAAISQYSPTQFVLAVISLVLFPIGVGMLNRGRFVTMIFSFCFAVIACILIGYFARGGLP